MGALSEGHTLAGRFTLERRIGVGGMGEVWRAHDAERGEDVALKILSAELAAKPAMVELLQRECENARRLTHPGVVGMHGAFSDGDVRFLAMQLVEDGSFRRFAGQPLSESLPALLPVLEGLEAAHAQGIVHRDVKLGNVLLGADSAARLSDFGIAAVPEDALRSGGSPYSMSPQQVDREPPAPADDIYALGVLLYELAAGQPPFYPDVTPGARLRPAAQAPPRECVPA